MEDLQLKRQSIKKIARVEGPGSSQLIAKVIISCFEDTEQSLFIILSFSLLHLI